MAPHIELLNMIRRTATYQLISHYVSLDPPHESGEAKRIVGHLLANLDTTAITRGIRAANECRIEDDGVLHRSPVQMIVLRAAADAYLPYARTNGDLRAMAFAREIADAIHWSHEKRAVADAKAGVVPQFELTEEEWAGEMERRYEADRKGRRPVKPLYRV